MNASTEAEIRLRRNNYENTSRIPKKVRWDEIKGVACEQKRQDRT